MIKWKFRYLIMQQYRIGDNIMEKPFMEQKPIGIGTSSQYVDCISVNCNECDFDCGYKKTMKRLNKKLDSD
jgi:hypothetical protein